jgi:hypothetical protein
LHELSHIRRYDYLINFVIKFIQAILYFNPFVKAFVKIVEREREKSCDEMVLQFQYDSNEYATALLTLEKINHEYKPLVIGIAGRKNELLKRVELILGVKNKSTFSFSKLTGLLAGLICIISINTLLIFSKAPQGKNNGSAATLSSPFIFFANTIAKSSVTPEPKDEKAQVKTNNNKEVIETPELEGPGNIKIPLPNNPEFINVTYTPVEVLHLKKYKEEQVKEAMDASKKVLENEEWKALENNFADVFTQKEKNELKTTYQQELGKIDWNKLENKLRLAYDQVNWNKVNEQLSKAINNIRIDSLQKVYNEAICKLDMTKKELSLNAITCIPDTDVSLKTIEEKKQQMQSTLNRLKAVRNKKIVHL